MKTCTKQVLRLNIRDCRDQYLSLKLDSSQFFANVELSLGGSSYICIPPSWKSQKTIYSVENLWVARGVGRSHPNH